MLEIHRKSLIKNASLHFEWAKVYLKCPNGKIQMRHFEGFLNQVNHQEKNQIKATADGGLD